MDLFTLMINGILFTMAAALFGGFAVEAELQISVAPSTAPTFIHRFRSLYCVAEIMHLSAFLASYSINEAWRRCKVVAEEGSAFIGCISVSVISLKTDTGPASIATVAFCTLVGGFCLYTMRNRLMTEEAPASPENSPSNSPANSPPANSPIDIAQNSSAMTAIRKMQELARKKRSGGVGSDVEEMTKLRSDSRPSV